MYHPSVDFTALDPRDEAHDDYDYDYDYDYDESHEKGDFATSDDASDPHYYEQGEEENALPDHEYPTPQYRPYSRWPYLEPITTGETLQLAEDTGRDSDQTGSHIVGNPFLDSNIPVTPPTVHYLDHSPIHTVDHFQYDSESYASGIYSGLNHRALRSRSPTPAAEDEGNTSFQSTASAPDAEKGTFHGGYRGSYTSYGSGPAPSYGSDPESPPPSKEEQPVETRHFGPAPVGRIVRRNNSKKRVRLVDGKLVVELPIPPKLALPHRGSYETRKTRYQAITCGPDEFEQKGFTLRQNLMHRRTELFIVVTMYNEDEVLFCRTMHAVMRNIAHLCTRKKSQTWGPEAWKKVVVCIVADGRRKVHPRVLDCLTLLGVYQPGGPLVNSVDKKDVQAHLQVFLCFSQSLAADIPRFEYTTSFSIDSNLKFRYPDKGIVPTQIIFCMKEKNQKKINSHRWFFNAFAPLLQPNVCVLLDVGTVPGPTSIYRLWKTFDLNSRVAGACGEICAYKGKNWSLLLNPLVAAQNFEYKMSNILEKPVEDIFGYISVLPGAFSAYRYIAIQNNKHGLGPLASYFKGEVLHGHDTDIFTSNMYLAEDVIMSLTSPRQGTHVTQRILCFELVAKANSDWILKFVKNAVAETDVPDGLPEFISQRRRWLNGSFFAATYAIAHVGQILRSGHSKTRKTFLMIETGYTAINLLFSWFSLANFFIFFVVLTSSLEDPYFKMPAIKYANTVVQYTLIAVIIACFLLAMGNKPRAAKWKYQTASILFAVLMMYMIFASVLCALAAAHQGGQANSVMLFSLVITYGLYASSSILAFDPWHMVTSFLPYLLLSPTYINILNIYAFSNLDDISWGTKQDSVVEPDLGAVVQNIHAQVDVEMATNQADKNLIYEEALSNIKNRKPAFSNSSGLSHAERDQAAKDYYAKVRTIVLLAWVLSNGALLAGVLGGGAEPAAAFSGQTVVGRTKGYLIFILVFTTLQSLIRFMGSTTYLLIRLITGN
ncbi:unnamed protein product [Mycena citricolor]|uniref:Chitin synthase n=1 Tax=Mycena citricolor TaxID=2018698 RepID=A0AAD2HUU3_9AGAR|nr:unnamed protein product [Mycena citricolor]